MSACVACWLLHPAQALLPCLLLCSHMDASRQSLLSCCCLCECSCKLALQVIQVVSGPCQLRPGLDHVHAAAKSQMALQMPIADSHMHARFIVLCLRYLI